MIAEQSTSSAFLLSADRVATEIEMTVRMEIPATGVSTGADVSTLLSYEPKVPERLQDELHRGLFDGVHQGLALVDSPLPEGGIAVEVTRLVIAKPGLEILTSDNSVRQVATTLESLIACTVASLWKTLIIISKPTDR